MSGFHGKNVCLSALFILSTMLQLVPPLSAEQVPAPTFSQPGGTYHTPVTVTLSCATPGAQIFYTLNGADPTPAATCYTGNPILVYRHVSGDTLQGFSDNDPDSTDDYATLTNTSAVLRAIAVKDGWENSPVSEAIYVIDCVDAALNIPFADPPPAGGSKHQLDIYQPHDRKNTPVLFFVHGGAWRQGDKNLYMELGNTFAGMYHLTTVVVNYQLSTDPWNAVHPTHVEDVALAFAWVVQHIAEYGGDPENIFVFGQSAGAHLLSLLATDERYLAAHGLGIDKIRKIISMSGAYNLPNLVQWPQNPLDLTVDEVLMYKTLCLSTFGGWEDADLNPASPAKFIGVDQPPFLIISLNETDTFHDMPGFRKDAINFYEKIKALNGPTVELTYLSETDIPPEILQLDFPGDFDAHYQEIYAINTEYWDCKSAQIVAAFVQPPPAAPELREPVADATNVATTAAFLWNSDLSASYYWLQVAGNFNFENSVFDAAIGDTSWVVSGLTAGQNYFWRVKAVSALGKSDWSAARTFTTENSASVISVPVIAQPPDLLRSYPNPFNGAVRIEFQFNRVTEKVRLEIFNLLGRVVYSKEMSVANELNYMNWQPDTTLESGIYFIRLQAGSENRVHRMIYLK
jgi:acetyl esterase/lipase